jgi:hypothetical protein
MLPPLYQHIKTKVYTTLLVRIIRILNHECITYEF